MKKFLVINTSYFGDVLLTDSLCQNIKIEYPDSWVIFMVNKPFYEAAKYMEGVDEVLCYDKWGKHKGVLGIFKFLKEYRKNYKNEIDVALVLYGNERGIFIAKAFGANTIISDNRGILHYLFSTKTVERNSLGSVQRENANLLKCLTKKDALDLPIKYTPHLEAVTYVQNLFHQLNITRDDELIGLCATSKKIEKDMPVSTAVKVIADLNKAGKKVILLGAGSRAAEYVAQLHAHGCSMFLDLTDKTSIAQLAGVIQKCSAVISVDTGTLHLTCALGVPLVALFYINDRKHLEKWAPAEYYPHVLLTGDITAKDIRVGLQTLLV
ncbi:hypothetical protein SCACP_32230 [Sporomusa carbonis]|uniref:glycosyltransferase family 9 protein n=1 Tax=Sporomusa carbonis TaxID=3076075 RepID=UPI003A75D095